jgi:hypothetical protein
MHVSWTNGGVRWADREIRLGRMAVHCGLTSSLLDEASQDPHHYWVKSFLSPSSGCAFRNLAWDGANQWEEYLSRGVYLTTECGCGDTG